MVYSGLVSLAFLLASANLVDAQSFSCRIGTKASCLSYGETICSSSGKCVQSDATCFSSYTCNYEGFTCKSNLTECFDAYDNAVADNNVLVDDYNELLSQTKSLKVILEDTQDDLSALGNKFRNQTYFIEELETEIISLDSEIETLKSDFESAVSCVANARTVGIARKCF